MPLCPTPSFSRAGRARGSSEREGLASHTQPMSRLLVATPASGQGERLRSDVTCPFLWLPEVSSLHGRLRLQAWGLAFRRCWHRARVLTGSTAWGRGPGGFVLHGPFRGSPSGGLCRGSQTLSVPTRRLHSWAGQWGGRPLLPASPLTTGPGPCAGCPLPWDPFSHGAPWPPGGGSGFVRSRGSSRTAGPDLPAAG